MGYSFENLIITTFSFFMPHYSVAFCRFPIWISNILHQQTGIYDIETSSVQFFSINSVLLQDTKKKLRIITLNVFLIVNF